METDKIAQDSLSKAREAEQQGVALHQAGRLVAAIQWYRKSLEYRHDNFGILCNLGFALTTIGDLEEAVACLEKAILIKPDFPEAYCNLGNAKKEQGKLAEAAACYQKAILLKADYAQAHSNLGNILTSQGKLDMAVASYQQAIAIKADYCEAYCHLGVALKEQGRLEEAVASYQQAIAIKADYAGAYSNLGAALQEQGKFNESIANYQKAISINPHSAATLNNLGVVLREQGNLDASIASLQKAIAIKPDHADFYNNLALSQRDQGRSDMAIASLEKAIAIKPDHAKAHNNLGLILNDQGKLDAAIAAHQKALAIQPDFPEAYYNLSLVKKYSDFDDIKIMENLLSNQTLADDKVFMHFALGKALYDMQQNQEAFQHFIEANRLKRASINFNIREEEKIFNRFQKIFNSGFFAERAGFGCQDKSPIFIVGMMRSGSTLIEQILSSHPDVYGAGELSIVKRIVLQKMSSRLLSMIPHFISRMSMEDVLKMGEEYISQIREIDPDSRYIIDKMPINFLNVGIIKLMLPNAKIIHSVRSPEDTCLSIFRTKFTGVHNYAYELTELGQYYRLYSEMMAHWNRVFPGVVYSVNYEKLTADQEGETRKLLEFCQLDWSDKCLDFQKTVRSVKTASSAQVRQPMYKSSVGGWRKFEKQLQPLRAALGDLAT
ncbi:MAG: tetratricopeptide repeat protein [Magnetococcales bacterium]|nr:tetratricopeptide repeat protein [Magnetococcales bacterium]